MAYAIRWWYLEIFWAIFQSSIFNVTIFIMVLRAAGLTALVNISLSLLECSLEGFVTFLCVWYQRKSWVSQHGRQDSKVMRVSCSPSAGEQQCLEGLETLSMSHVSSPGFHYNNVL